MKVSHAKIYQCISFFLILSIFVTTLTSCNNGNSKTAVVQKTELTSTEGVNYELTPTVEDPETEVATATPTWTLTPEPSPTATATATETPKPTEVEKYPIDLEKLSTTPESYQYLLDHKEKFVKGPDPLEVGVEEFFKWYNENLIPSLGDYKERDGNVYYYSVGAGEERCGMSGYNLDGSFKGQMEFWYFEHGGVVYPVLEIQGMLDDGSPLHSVGVVLVEGLGPGPSVVIKEIKNGQKEFSGLTIFVKDKEKMPVSGDVHRMLEEGIFYSDPEGRYFFGIGSIGFR